MTWNPLTEDELTSGHIKRPLTAAEIAVHAAQEKLALALAKMDGLDPPHDGHRDFAFDLLATMASLGFVVKVEDVTRP